MTGLWTMRDYVRRRQATIAEYILGHPIFELCMRDESGEVYSWFLRWWDQDHGEAEEGV